jgi:hypothetical protein
LVFGGDYKVSVLRAPPANEKNDLDKSCSAVNNRLLTQSSNPEAAGQTGEVRGEKIMNETQPPRRIGRTIFAVLTGLLAVIVLSTGTDALLYAIGVFPPLGHPLGSPLLVLATVYRTVYSVLGSYLAARLASDRPMGHALALGVLGLVVSIAGAVVTWNHVPSLGPHWYPIALIVLAMPAAWVGGKLFGAQSRPSSTP